MKQQIPGRPASRRKRKWPGRIGILLLLIIGVLAVLPFLAPPVETLAMDDAARAGTDGGYCFACPCP